MKSLLSAYLLVFAIFLCVGVTQCQYEVSANETIGNQIRMNLHYIGNSQEYLTAGNLVLKDLKANVTYESDRRLDVRITNFDQNRFEIPAEEPFPHKDLPPLPEIPSGAVYRVNITQRPFSFSIKRKASGETIFDTTKGNLAFSERYLEFSSVLPTPHVYGYGERTMNFELKKGTYTIWTRDILAEIEDGSGNIHSIYGAHPVILVKEASGNFFILFLRNAAAQDLVIDDGKLTWKSIGGIFHFKFFFGDEKPETAIRLYHEYIGGWTMPAFWSLGYHQCRWGYVNLKNLEDVVANHQINDIPLDTIWMDIDYMRDYQIFTFDESRYPLQSFYEFIKKTKIKFVPILDPGVGIKYPDAPSYKEGLGQKVFLPSPNLIGNNLLGSVWPGYVHFPDWFKPETEKYWSDMLKRFHELLKWNGLWLDMNEVANFCNGECNANGMQIFPPYIPGRMSLEVKTIPLNTRHVNNVSEYDVHNLYGSMESYLTYKTMRQLGINYPFILTRSSFAGAGAYAAHWTGDNAATWDFLRYSLPAIFNFNLFGIPMVGADICGFHGNTEAELCARWIQLGAFYPFARNHNHEGFLGQELYALGPTVYETGRKSLKLRYAILKYYFSLFIRNARHGTVFRPLFFEFPNDDLCYSEEVVNFQFLMGEQLMGTPVLYKDVSTITPYFPKGAWFEFNSGDMIQGWNDKPRKRLVHNKLGQPLPLYLRGGHIVPFQEVGHVMTTDDLDHSFRLVVGLDTAHDRNPNLLFEARGFILGINNYTDYDIEFGCERTNCMVDILLTVDKKHVLTIDFTLVNPKFDLQQVTINRLLLYGLRGVPMEFETKTMMRATIYPRVAGAKPLETHLNVLKLKARNGYQILTHDFNIKDYSRLVLRLPS
eukprot:TRINITY_DN2625_c0_g1_i6.p1 TRINITY_DN2625_c0_g1~~TRINITY_DN2625_c0_g1_i6.p1  ORF type:complete len:880 (+),score=183.67 TRINITY_DN2625_c0_g1_i6:118-2757(+)